MTSKKFSIKKKVLFIYHYLVSSPSSWLNNSYYRYYESLLKLILAANDNVIDKLLSDPDIKKVQPHLRSIWANYEYQREKTWSWKIINSKEPSFEIKKYPAYVFYKKLISFEFGISNALYKRALNRILFIGSGPLPISSILLAENYDIYVDCLDIQKEACEISSKLIPKLGLSGKINFMHKDITKMKSVETYDVIILATLAGETDREKQALLRYLIRSIKKDQILIIRTVQGLRSLLYPMIREKYLRGFQIQFQNKISTIINSVIVVKKQ